MNRILKPYLSNSISRKTTIDEILLQYKQVEKSLIYHLGSEYSRILRKDERKPSWKKRFPDSPFPLLSSIQCYKNSVGSYNKELLKYGHKHRLKSGDYKWVAEETPGTHIAVMSRSSLVQKSNRYLESQYRRLRKYRSTNRIASYWKLSWSLMRTSWSYKIASLNSWKKSWYKELSLNELQRLFRQLNRILNFEEIQTTITNVWIESPKNKGLN